MTVNKNRNRAQHRILLTQFLTFTGIGAIGTLGHYTVLIGLVQRAEVDPVYASTLGFMVGAVVNYFLNYRFTFRSTKRHSDTILKFMVVAVVGMLINAAIMTVGVQVMNFNYLIIQIISTGIVLLSNFALNKVWTFSQIDSCA